MTDSTLTSTPTRDDPRVCPALQRREIHSPHWYRYSMDGHRGHHHCPGLDPQGALPATVDR